MKNKPVFITSFVIAITLIGSAAYAINADPRTHEITNYIPGHTHDEGTTQGAPQHSGGTNKYGCHNKSVPYHCH